MGIGMLAFAAAAVGFQWVEHAPPLFFGVTLLVLGVGLMCLRYGRLPAALILGIGWSAVHASLALRHRLPRREEGADLLVTGEVVSVPSTDALRTRFVFRPRTIDEFPKGRPLPRLLRVSWYRPHPSVRPGDVYRLPLRLKRPHGFMNPGGFDYERWLFVHRIDAVGYVHGAGGRLLKRSRFSLVRWRQREAHALFKAAGKGTGARIVAALGTGDREFITDSQWDVFRDTGTGHLMAISGLHIGMVASLVFLLISALWRRIPPLTIRYPAPVAGAVVAVAGAAAYSVMTGFALPAQRALVMLAVGCVAAASRRSVNPFRVLLAALVVVILLDPFAGLAPGFWLSFGAVGAIFILAAERLPATRHKRRLPTAQLCLSLALVPLMAMWFRQIPASAPVANIVAIPVVSMLVVPGTLAGMSLLHVLPGAASCVLRIDAWIMKEVASFLSWLAALVPSWNIAAPSWISVCLALTGGLLFMAPRNVFPRLLSLSLMAPLVLKAPAAPPRSSLRMTVLDVGQGLAVVVRTAHHTLIYDTGPRFGPEFTAGDAVVVPFLRAQGVKRVDRLVLSHSDEDHSGGAVAVIAAFPVLSLYGSEPVPRLGAALQPCVAGQHWRWDGVRFRFLYPFRDTTWTGNNRSCVLAVTVDGHRVLLTGDIQKKAEGMLLRRYRPATLDSDVLVVPHHGSNTSSTSAFLAAVSPHYAVFSVGYRNQWHFPRRRVLRRYREAGARLLRTDAAGAIRFSIDESVTVSRYRNAVGRYFND